MIIITIIFILVYLLYPFWVKKQKTQPPSVAHLKEIENVSIVYLSQNYATGLKEKLSFLLEEISSFKKSEIIVIDDASSDGSAEILQKLNTKNLRIITKKSPKGIPHSMNLGIQMCTFQHIVFCDQRQMLEKGIIKKLTAPLRHNEIGAVSACISGYDKSNKIHLLRVHENIIKKVEGQSGNLIGVYGPLYALKKECYKEIPDNIILDDLYLTLNILKNKQVIFQNDCLIYDDDFELLYSYKRAKRYLAGFFQILGDKRLLQQLTKKQRLMLFWHKYFRIPIPFLITISYILIVLQSIHNYTYFLAISIISIIGAFLLLPINLAIFRQFKSIMRFVFFYTMASVELFVKAYILNQNIYEK